jgi:hypothetical protein
MDNYFNLNSPGNDPLGTITAPPSSVGPQTLVDTDCFLAYVAPFNGEVVRVNVNSAFSRGFFNTATFDFIIMKPGPPILTAGQTQWTVGQYITTRQMSGWSDSFVGPTTFNAGDLIFCYIVDNNSDYWGNLTLPIPSDNGIFNVTLYLRFSI